MTSPVKWGREDTKAAGAALWPMNTASPSHTRVTCHRSSVETVPFQLLLWSTLLVPEEMGVEQLWSLDNPVFKAFISYGMVVVLKTMAMTVLTIRQRIAHQVSARDATFDP